MFYYHGTSALLPFRAFESGVHHGIVNTHRKNYWGTFLTSSLENAKYFTENWVAKCVFSEEPTRVSVSNHRELRKWANYYINRPVSAVLIDGICESEIVFVPKDADYKIVICEWIFVGDKEEFQQELRESLELHHYSDFNEYLKWPDLIADPHCIPFYMAHPIIREVFQEMENYND